MQMIESEAEGWARALDEFVRTALLNVFVMALLP